MKTIHSRLALVHNPYFRRNRRDRHCFENYGQHVLGPLFYQPKRKDGIREAIIDMVDKQVDCIIVNGGDGTVSNVMTAIYHRFTSDNMPSLVVFPSGNTNLIASDIGFGHRGIKALNRFIDIYQAKLHMTKEYVRKRHALGVRWADQQRPAGVSTSYYFGA